MSPLQWASSSSNTEIIQLLLTAGANPNHVGKNGNTPLHQAAYNDQGDVIRLLVASGADIKAKTAQGSTPYSTALSNGKYHALGALLRAGENPNQLGLFGRTRLHQAVMKNNPSLVAVLVRNGANIDARDMNGETPLEIAVGQDKDAIAEILRSGGATETSRTKESDGSVLEGLLTGALVGAGIGAVVSGDVDPETLSQIADTLSKSSGSSIPRYPTTTSPATIPSNNKAIAEANAKNRCVEITNSYIPAISAIPIGNSIREQAQNSIKRNNLTLEGLNKCLAIIPVGTQSYNEVYQQALAVKADSEQSMRIFNQVNVTDQVVPTQPNWEGTNTNTAKPPSSSKSCGPAIDGPGC